MERTQKENEELVYKLLGTRNVAKTNITCEYPGCTATAVSTHRVGDMPWPWWCEQHKIYKKDAPYPNN